MTGFVLFIQFVTEMRKVKENLNLIELKTYLLRTQGQKFTEKIVAEQIITEQIVTEQIVTEKIVTLKDHF